MDDTSAYDQVMYIIKMLFIAATVVVLMFMIYVFAYQNIKVDVLEIQTLVESTYSSPEIFAYEDNLTKRAYPGVIDLEKFKKIELNDKIKTIRKDIVMKVELFEGVDSNSGNQATYSQLLATKYFVPGKEPTEENFDIAAVLVGFEERATTLNDYPVIKPVQIVKNNEIVTGQIKYYVVKQK